VKLLSSTPTIVPASDPGVPRGAATAGLTDAEPTAAEPLGEPAARDEDAHDNATTTVPSPRSRRFRLDLIGPTS
jgi:hypothetical protein